MKIAIDIDETITETQSFYYKLALDYDRNYLGKNSYIDENKIIARSDDWIEKEMDYYLINIVEKNVPNIPLKKDADKYIKMLQEESFEIIIITTRGMKDFDNSDLYTEKFLKENDIPFNDLIMNVEDKYQYLEDVDFFIDDSINECEKMLENCRRCNVIMMETKNNKEYKNESIVKIDNWKDIYEYIIESTIKSK